MRETEGRIDQRQCITNKEPARKIAHDRYSSSRKDSRNTGGFGSVKTIHNTSSSLKVSCNKSLLTVFQAAPLVCFHDDDENIHPVNILDFESEQKQLTESISNGHFGIDIAYDIATTERLQLFLAKGEGRVLHFSCHGHPDYLAIEDGWGAMHQLPVENLKEWISAGGNNLLFVFVSACHSRSAGEAFLKAGVKHVVCCQRDDQPIRNLVAVYFARAFYQALANGKRLGEAFELARQSVKNCPELIPSVRQSEVEKFALLPEGVNHNICIFESSHRNSDMHADLKKSSIINEYKRCNVSSNRILPAPPHIFEGRQVDMYHILDALRVARLVRVTGTEEGIGKCCVVQAICQYIQKRKLMFSLEFSEILWLPFQEKQGQDSMSDIIADISMLFWSNIPQEIQHESRQQFIRYLYQDDRKLLILDARESQYSKSIRNISSLINEIIQTTQTRIIVIQNSKKKDDLIGQLPCVERDVIIASLDFISTVHLFGKLCQHIAKRQHADISNHLEFSSLLIPAGTERYEPRKSYRGRSIFKMLGEGNPAKIHYAAKNMTVEEYTQMIALALRKEHCFNFKSRIELERKSSSLSLEVTKAAEEKRFLDAQDFQDQFDEIEILRESLPDYHSLLSLADSIQTDQQRAVQDKDFLVAHQLQEQYDALQEKILNERDAMKRLGIKEEDLQDSVKEDFEMTRVELEAQIDALEEELNNACNKNDFTSCRKIDSQINKMKQRRGNLPSKEELHAEIEELNSCLAQAKSTRDWDLADDILAKIQKVNSRIEKEIQVALQLENSIEEKSSSNMNINIPGAFAIAGPSSAAPISNSSNVGYAEDEIVNETFATTSDLPTARPVASLDNDNDNLSSELQISHNIEDTDISSRTHLFESTMKKDSAVDSELEEVKETVNQSALTETSQSNVVDDKNEGEYSVSGAATIVASMAGGNQMNFQHRNYDQNNERERQAASQLNNSGFNNHLRRQSSNTSGFGDNFTTETTLEEEGYIAMQQTTNVLIAAHSSQSVRSESMVENLQNTETSNIVVPTAQLPIQVPISAELHNTNGVHMQNTDRLFLEQMIQESISNMIVPAVKVEKIDLPQKPRRMKKGIKKLLGLKKTKW